MYEWDWKKVVGYCPKTEICELSKMNQNEIWCKFNATMEINKNRIQDVTSKNQLLFNGDETQFSFKGIHPIIFNNLFNFPLKGSIQLFLIIYYLNLFWVKSFFDLRIKLLYYTITLILHHFLKKKWLKFNINEDKDVNNIQRKM